MSDPRAGRACDAALLLFAFALPLSIAASEIALGLALVAWAFTRPWTRTQAPGVRAVAWASLALAATWLLASATAPAPGPSFVNARKLYSILVVLLVADRARGERGTTVARVALLGGGVSAAFGLVTWAAAKLAGAIPFLRLESVFSTAMTTGNVYATLAVAGLGVLLSGVGGRAVRGATAAAVAALGAALLGTLTRSSWIAFVAGAAVLVGRARPRLLVLLSVLVGTLVAFGPFELRSRALSVFDPAHPSNAGRISLWKSGLAAIADRPWTGVGLADHYQFIEHYRRADATFHAGHFHNNLVQVAASTGLVGLAAWLAWMGIAAVLLARGARRPGVGPALVGLAVWVTFQAHGMFDWSFGDIEVVNQFYLWVGLGLAAAAPAAPSRAPAGT